MSVQQLAVNILSSEEDKKKLLKVIRECSDSMTRVQSEKELIRESISAISKELDIPKKLVTKMVKVYFKQNFDEEVAVQDQFETLYQKVIK